MSGFLSILHSCCVVLQVGGTWDWELKLPQWTTIFLKGTKQVFAAWLWERLLIICGIIMSLDAAGCCVACWESEIIAQIFLLSSAAVLFLALPPSLSLCVPPAGRPGSRVFSHQQYPCWCHPKGESVCLRNIHIFCPDHSAQNTPTKTLLNRSGETATMSHIVCFSSVV